MLAIFRTVVVDMINQSIKTACLEQSKRAKQGSSSFFASRNNGNAAGTCSVHYYRRLNAHILTQSAVCEMGDEYTFVDTLGRKILPT